LLDKFLVNGGKRFVFAGTCAEYDWSYSLLEEEKTPLHPSTLYGKCKHLFEEQLGRLSEDASFSWACARIFFVYGPHQSENRFVSYIMNGLLSSTSPVCKYPNLIRDYIYVEDVASSLITILESNFEGAVNVGSGKGVSLGKLAEMIEKKISSSFLLESAVRFERGTSESNSLIASISKLTAIGWKPSFTLDEGLDCTIDWWAKKSRSDK